MTDTQQETIKSGKKQKYAVRYGYLGFLGEFEYDADESLIPGQKVLIETERGLELGTVVCRTNEPDEYLRIDTKQIQNFIEKSGENYLIRNAGRIVRIATEQDIREANHIEIDAIEKKKVCAQAAKKLGLDMKIVFVEHLFGGERIIFYFLADGRVDFRELVRELAREYQTRIELRQIGARDEARLLADYEICGRECCCKNFLKTLRPVNMKMAKLQKATLDPSKVSGRCGRLRCCLQFEQKTYEELLKTLPKSGTWVETEAGIGKVKDCSAITQLVQVEFEDKRIISFPVEEITPISPEQRQDKQQQNASKQTSGQISQEQDDKEPIIYDEGDLQAEIKSETSSQKNTSKQNQKTRTNNKKRNSRKRRRKKR